jgi:hypothetical protein
VPYLPGSRREPLWLRATRVIDRAYAALCALREEVALAFVPPRTWSAITLERYSQRARFYRDELYQATGLFGWESAAIARWFPAPPATILVGGAGAGREALALVARGYRVAAFEPTPPLFQALCDNLARAQHDAPIALGGYEDLIEAISTSAVSAAQAPMRVLCRAGSCDAIVLGFGSLSYCIEAQVRESLLPALARLCPAGPILLSFEESLPRAGRAAALARFARRCLRLAPGSHALAEGDQLGDTGFEHAFTDAEIEGLAHAAGYRVAQFDRCPSAHAVLVRAAPA